MKRKQSVKSIFSMLMVFALVVGLIPAIPAEAAKKVTVKKVTVSSSLSGSTKTVVVAKGKKVKLSTSVTVTPNKSANKKVTYKSQDTKIATVTSKGVVKGVKAGSTKVTVTSKTDTKKKATIAVKVKSGAVTKVTLNKKTATLNVGDSDTLKATVKAAKGADKTIAWKTSNKKVATVSKKGVVKAVGAGSATITAQAIDGSGKKATYKVTVKDPIFLTSVAVLNAQSVTFSLNKAFALDPTAVTIMQKTYANGTYRAPLTIDNMSTTDNVNYTVVLNNDSLISENRYVQVSIPSLTGNVKAMEVMYTEPATAYTKDTVSSWDVNKYKSEDFYFNEGDGYSSYSITNLPAGLTAESKIDSNGRSVLRVKGTPTTAGATVAVLSAIDELGNTLTRNVYFVIGSDASVVAAATPTYGVSVGDKIQYSNRIYARGGSGSYRYQVLDAGGVATTKANEYLSGNYVYADIAMPGQYNVVVRVSDILDDTKRYDVVVPYTIAQGISVGGAITDAMGNKIASGVEIEFKNKNKANRYPIDTSASPDYETGVYSAVLVAGTYDITASYSGGASDHVNATRYLYNQSLATTQTGFDIQLPLYKVMFTGMDDNKSATWYYDHESMGRGDTIYVKAGNYALETSEWTIRETDETTGTSAWNTYKYEASVSVVNTGVQVGAVKKLVDSKPAPTPAAPNPGAGLDVRGTVQIGVQNVYAVSGSDDNDESRYTYYSFIAPTTGYYYFWSIGTTDVSSQLVNGDGEQLVYGDDELDDAQFYYSYYCTAGTTYYVGMHSYEGVPVNTNLNISTTPHPNY